MASLTQREAEVLIKNAQNKAEQLNIKVSACVVDTSGTPVALSRMDGAGMQTPDIARAKAYSAILFGRNTKDFFLEFKDNPVAAASLMKGAGDRAIILPGGVLVMREGEVAGAIGVSGGSGFQDHDCAIEAAK
jgi:uncharacterized protein GlcG (DUF336 family)